MSVASYAGAGTADACPALPHEQAVATRRVADIVERLAECAAIALLLATTAIALLQVFCRYVLGDALPWPEEAVKFLFVWFVFLGAAMVTRLTSVGRP